MKLIVQHNFEKRYKSIPWAVCTKCGLVKLRNPLTLWAVQHGCDYREHPNYTKIKTQLG